MQITNQTNGSPRAPDCLHRVAKELLTKNIDCGILSLSEKEIDMTDIIETTATRMLHIWNAGKMNSEDPQEGIMLLVSSAKHPIIEVATYAATALGAQCACVSIKHLTGLMGIDEIDVDLMDKEHAAMLRAAKLFVDEPILKQIAEAMTVEGEEA